MYTFCFVTVQWLLESTGKILLLNAEKKLLISYRTIFTETNLKPKKFNFNMK